MRLVYLTVALATALLTTAGAVADVLHLENGNRLRGKILSETERAVVIEVPYGKMTVPRKQIRSIEREQESEYLRRTGERLTRFAAHDQALSFLRRSFEEDRDNEANRQALITGLGKAAQREVDEKRYQKSETLLDELAALDPKSPLLGEQRTRIAAARRARADKQKAARAALDGGDFASATQLYQELVEEFPEGREQWRRPFAVAALRLGHQHFRAERFEESRGAYHIALAHDPDLIPWLAEPLAYAEVRVVAPLLEGGSFAEARRQLSEAHDLLPDDPAILYHLALAFQGEQKMSEAVRLYRRITGEERRTIDPARELAALRTKAEQILTQAGGGELARDPRWAGAKEKPSVRKSKSFAIHHQNLALAREVAVQLEHHMRRLRKEWFRGSQPPRFQGGIEVFVHPDKAAYLSAASPPPWSDGVHRCERRYGVIVSQELHFNGSAPQFVSATIPHELAHLMLPHRIGAGLRIPLWIDEGVATLQEPAYKQHYYERIALEAYKENRLFGLAQLCASREYPPEERVPLFYAQSNSVVRFIFLRLGTRDGFALLRMLSSEDSAEGLSAVGPFDSLQDLERGWRKWLADR